MRRFILLLAAMFAALVVVGGVALAKIVEGTNHDEVLRGPIGPM